jgi:solute carrier family 25 carnitine/acylcarnitine transporter 20/29
MSKDKQNRSKSTKMAIDLIAGTIAGINVTLVGHPFDTLKVRLQTQPHTNPIYSGLVDCFKKTVKWEGFFNGLYKGVQAPLMGQMFFRANLFLAFGEAKRYFSNYGQRSLRVIDYYYSGAIAWAFGALAECPIDFFKTQMQIQIIKSKTIKDYVPEYTSMSDCFSKVIKRNGIFGAYQGFVPHLLRNVPGGALHLGTFEYVRLISAEKRNCKVHELPIKYNLLAGSMGGILFWLVMFPMDVIKSSIQGDSPIKENRRFHGIADVATKLYSEGGLSRFYRGFSPCMLRSVPANAVLLYTSSYLSEHL